MKWTALERDGRAARYYSQEVERLTTDTQRGAYEWLVSLREVEAWRARLGPRLFEFRYQDLTDQPYRTLKAVMDSVGLACPSGWLDQAAARVRPASTSHGEPLALPGQMCADFNSQQAGFGFTGRATVDISVPAGRSGSAGNGRRSGNSAPAMVKPRAGIQVASLTSLPEAGAMTAEWAQLAETTVAASTSASTLADRARYILRPPSGHPSEDNSTSNMPS